MNIKQTRQFIDKTNLEVVDDSLLNLYKNNINGLKYIDAPSTLKSQTKSVKAFKAAQNSNFQPPINANLSSLMTKPENQNPYGTCVAWSSTTFVESMLWKLTGEKEEFTTDEVYNLYLDAWQYNPNTDSFEEVDASIRKQMRSDAGAWTLHSRYDTGLYHYLGNFSIQFDYPLESEYKDMQIYVFYWIAHYNDPEVRKNHYPDKFSKICEKFKNYMWNNLYTYGLGTTSEIGRVIDPEIFKQNIQAFGNPMYAGLRGSAGGHGVVLMDYTPSTVSFDSSWNSSKIYNITFTYNNTLPYYNGTSYQGLSYLGGIDVFRDFYIDYSNKYTLSILGSHIYGVENLDRFPARIPIPKPIVLIADSSFIDEKTSKVNYFSAWSISSFIQAGQSRIEKIEKFNNVLSIGLSSDCAIEALYSDDVNNISSTYTLYALSTTNCQIDVNPKSTNADQISYDFNTNVTALAMPSDNYIFECWNDGNTSNPRTITMSSNHFLRPIVKKDPSTLTQLSDLNLQIDNVIYAVNTLSTCFETKYGGIFVKNKSSGNYLSANTDFILNSYSVKGDTPKSETSRLSIYTTIEGIGNYTGTLASIQKWTYMRGLHMIATMSLDGKYGLSDYTQYGTLTYENATVEYTDNAGNPYHNPSGPFYKKDNFSNKIDYHNGSLLLLWQPSTCKTSPKTLKYVPKQGYKFDGWYYGYSETDYPYLSNCTLYSTSNEITYDSSFPIPLSETVNKNHPYNMYGYGRIFGKISKT